MTKIGTYEHIISEGDFAEAKPYSHNISSFMPDTSNEWLHVPRWHEQFELKLILSGSAEVLCGTELYVANPGDVVLINPYEMHGLRLHGNEELRYYCLMLSPDFPLSPALDTRYTELFDGKYSFRRILSGCEAVNRVFCDLFNEFIENPRDCDIQSEAYIALLFSLLLRYAVEDRKNAVSAMILKQHGERIRPALNYIYFHYAEDISVPALAELCSMSLYHFCRVFKNVVGDTVVSQINALRMNKAALLLTTTKLSVGEVAAAVGFTDELYFSRRFKLEKGASPTKYRLNAQIQNEQKNP